MLLKVVEVARETITRIDNIENIVPFLIQKSVNTEIIARIEIVEAMCNKKKLLNPLQKFNETKARVHAIKTIARISTAQIKLS